MSVTLNFGLRTSAQCKTVHLLGSWDNYSGQLPLGKDPTKPGGWKGSFRFQGKTLRQGQRYWYYYIIDGYHVSHDPARESVVEPTTRRRLNILDVPVDRSFDPSVQSTRSSHEPAQPGYNRRRNSIAPAKGCSLSPSKIQSPLPSKPHATRHITAENFSRATVEQLSAKFARMPTNDKYGYSGSDFDSDNDSDVSAPSLTSRSSNSSTPSSVSSASSTSSSCTCERYGVTRAGARVKLDCGGSRCGVYSDDGSSDCGSNESDGDRYVRRPLAARRHGMVMGR